MGDIVIRHQQLNPLDLHDYQCLSVDHVLENDSSMLWLGLGLGKSICTLTTIAHLLDTQQIKAVLIVAPLRVCQLTWKQEALLWSHTEHLKFASMTGSKKKRRAALYSHANIYLINYESLMWLSLELKDVFERNNKEFPFDMVVFDEISKLKRSVSKRFHAFAPMLHHFKRKVGLTASPCSNGLQDMWAQFYCVDEGKRLGTDFSTFQHGFFFKGGGRFGKWQPYDDTREMIVDRIQDITVEMKASDHLDIPPLITIDVPVALPPKKMDEYLELEKNFYIELDNGVEIEIFNRAALCNKLLQFSSGICYLYLDENNPTYQTEEFVHDEKYKALEDIIDGSGDEPILLAYNFQSERREIMKRYPDAECLTGVKEESAVDIVNRFNAGMIKLLIAHPRSAGFGINLQKACHTVVLFGLSYDLESTEQFIGRVDRQGQQHPVQCFRILGVDTMDYAVREALESKDLSQKAMRDAINKHRKKGQ